jgi:hypothetical protein
MPAKSMLTPSRVVASGHIKITAPAIAIMLFLGLTAYLLSANLFSPDAVFAELGRVIVAVAVACPPACWWWRKGVYRWRMWVQAQQVDLAEVEKLAVRTLLV